MTFEIEEVLGGYGFVVNVFDNFTVFVFNEDV